MSTEEKIRAKAEELRQLRIQETLEELNKAIRLLNDQTEKITMLNGRLLRLQEDAGFDM